MRRRLWRDFIVSSLSGALLFVTTVVAAPTSQALDSCYILAAPRYITSNLSSSYAGAEASLTVYWDQNPPQDCIVGTRFRFIGGGGQDFQDSSPGFTREGSRVKSVATFTPKPGLSYSVEAYITWQMMGSPYEAYPNLIFLNSGRPFPEAPVPSGMSVPSLTGEDRTVTVSWSPPTTNASAVSKYRVNNALNGQQVCETSASALSCRFDGLPDGSYAYQVTALNSLGKGTTSGPTQIVKVAPPIAPVMTQVQSKGTQVTLRWNTATDSITVPRVYRVHNSSGAEVCGVPVTAADLSAGSMTCAPTVAAGTSTQFVVTVETAVGNASSTPTAVVTGTDPSRSKTCTSAQSALKAAMKKKNKKLISVANKRVTAACIARTINY